MVETDLVGFSDEEVVQRVLAGETELYEIVMRRYNQRLYRLARAILRDPDEAEDLIQETYVRAYAHLRQYSGAARFSTWLTRIAVNEALARVNRNKRTVPMPENEDGSQYEVRSDDPGPETRVSLAEARAFLEEGIDSLPEAYRSVFVLREVDGLSTTEAAECLDMNEENVRIRLHRARHMLRNHFYERARVASANVFQFLGPRCDRTVHVVLDRIRKTAAV